MRKSSGVTLIALVISIIVMLILAGVSINATVGENGILTKAQRAALAQKFSRYLEEFQMNKMGVMIDQGVTDELCLNLKGTEAEFLDYVPSIAEEDKPNFEIVAGYLVYIGPNSDEEEYAQSIGMKSQYTQAIYDVLGKEFEIYVKAVENAKVNGSISSSVQALTTASFDQINAGLTDGNKIPTRYKNEFILSNGTLTYTGTNEERLILLSTSSTLAQYIRPASGNAKLILQNYVAPMNGSVANTTTSNGRTVYVVQTTDNSKWTVRIDSSNGSMNYGTIIKYEGVGGIITIPDSLGIGSIGTVKITSIEGGGSGSGASRTFVHNIFQNESGTSVTTSKVTQVIVAKGINKIRNYALANIGDNRPFQILHDGADLNLDEGTGIEGSCGSYTFTAPTSGIYTLKCWGASGAGWDKVKAENNNWGSDAGYGGYSQGDISLSAGEKLYVNIGGKGLAAFEVIADTSIGTSNGSGGYNGGGNIRYANSQFMNAGGGSTDIRYNGSSISESIDYRILVAGGGGGVDDFASRSYNTAASQGIWGRNIKNETEAFNDGSGGAGGGTETNNKLTWNGIYGFVNGVLDNSACAIPGGWDESGNIIGYSRLMGENATTALSSNCGAGGGGYYGGYAGRNAEGGGGGGSAYADTEKLTNITGYSDHETLTRSNGTQVQGPMLDSEIPQVTYYGRSKKALTYGNGYVAIEKR